MSSMITDLSISELVSGYRAQRFSPADVMQEVLQRIEAAPERHVWIDRFSSDTIARYVNALNGHTPEELPLFGVPFAIKDNIDLAGVPTTAGCPEFSYVPRASAVVVQRLIDAGAIPIGKTNLDQFATGLVGVRSPYGACRNSFNAGYISGGSSSGSAVAVASGLVSFALGTDTAGSGRVPAAFNNLVGLKPSCGLLSTRGVVPACRSLDCVSIFALTAHDAGAVLRCARGFDPADPYSRNVTADQFSGFDARPAPRVGVPRGHQLNFFGDDEYAALFQKTCERARELGWQLVEIDFEPFLEVARLLYEGPWVAERYAAIADFIKYRADVLHPVTRQIIAGGAEPKAVDAFRAQYRLKELQRRAAAVWSDIDVLMTPTAGTIYTIDEVHADPIRLNSNLGYYTNFVNLLDLAAVATPAGFRADGLPFGVTLSAPAGADGSLLTSADALQRHSVERLGALEHSGFDSLPCPAPTVEGRIDVVVCGAHMRGLPLNHQLQDRAAVFIRSTRTTPRYEFFALAGGPPFRPGLVRANEGGYAIEVEVWSVPASRFGSFVASIPAPLGIGKVELEDGSWASGFLCEAHALETATQISHHGGWRNYLKHLSPR